MFILKNSKSISILKKQQPQIEIRLMRNRCIFWPNQPTNKQMSFALIKISTKIIFNASLARSLQFGWFAEWPATLC